MQTRIEKITHSIHTTFLTTSHTLYIHRSPSFQREQDELFDRPGAKKTCAVCQTVAAAALSFVMFHSRARKKHTPMVPSSQLAGVSFPLPETPLKECGAVGLTVGLG